MSDPYPILRHAITPFIKWRIREVNGLNSLPKTNYILVANHVGFLDPPLITALWAVKLKAKVYFIARKEIWQSFKKVGAQDWLGLIPIDSEDKTKCLDLANQYLKQGRIVGIFPEGRRSTDKNLLKGKTGAARLAIASGKPIVPVGFIGPAGWTTSESFKNLFDSSKKIIINIGSPLDFSHYHQQSLTKELLEDITRQIMQTLGDLCQKDYHY